MKNQLTITARRCIIATLLFPFWGLGGLYATVTVTPISADYATKKVTFKVAWTGTAAPNRVWVWIDLCPVVGTTPGTFAKAVLSNPATIPTGSLVTVAGNTRGFYVTDNPSTVTATLDNATGKFNWCAYGSDFPPNARDNGSSYTLKGSPPFIITTTSNTFSEPTNIFSGGAITALTDATGCPGVLCGKNGESSGLLDCCVTGTTNCDGACTTTGTYTSYDGACTGACNTAYTQTKNQCGTVEDATSGTFTNSACSAGCMTNDCPGCKRVCENAGWLYADLASGYCLCFNVCQKGMAVAYYQWDNNAWVFYMNTSDILGGFCKTYCQ